MRQKKSAPSPILISDSSSDEAEMIVLDDDVGESEEYILPNDPIIDLELPIKKNTTASKKRGPKPALKKKSKKPDTPCSESSTENLPLNNIVQQSKVNESTSSRKKTKGNNLSLYDQVLLNSTKLSQTTNSTKKSKTENKIDKRNSIKKSKDRFSNVATPNSETSSENYALNDMMPLKKQTSQLYGYEKEDSKSSRRNKRKSDSMIKSKSKEDDLFEGIKSPKSNSNKTRESIINKSDTKGKQKWDDKTKSKHSEKVYPVRISPVPVYPVQLLPAPSVAPLESKLVSPLKLTIKSPLKLPITTAIRTSLKPPFKSPLKTPVQSPLKKQDSPLKSGNKGQNKIGKKQYAKGKKHLKNKSSILFKCNKKCVVRIKKEDFSKYLKKMQKQQRSNKFNLKTSQNKQKSPGLQMKNFTNEKLASKKPETSTLSLNKRTNQDNSKVVSPQKEQKITKELRNKEIEQKKRNLEKEKQKQKQEREKQKQKEGREKQRKKLEKEKLKKKLEKEKMKQKAEKEQKTKTSSKVENTSKENKSLRKVTKATNGKSSPIFFRLPISDKLRKNGLDEKKKNGVKKSMTPEKRSTIPPPIVQKPKKLGKAFIRKKFGSKILRCYIKIKRVRHPELEKYRKQRRTNRKTVSFMEQVEVIGFSIEKSKDKSDNGNGVGGDLQKRKEKLQNEIGNTSTPVKSLLTKDESKKNSENVNDNEISVIEKEVEANNEQQQQLEESVKEKNPDKELSRKRSSSTSPNQKSDDEIIDEHILTKKKRHSCDDESHEQENEESVIQNGAPQKRKLSTDLTDETRRKISKTSNDDQNTSKDNEDVSTNEGNHDDSSVNKLLLTSNTEKEKSLFNEEDTSSNALQDKERGKSSTIHGRKSYREYSTTPLSDREESLSPRKDLDESEGENLSNKIFDESTSNGFPQKNGTNEEHNDTESPSDKIDCSENEKNLVNLSDESNDFSDKKNSGEVILTDEEDSEKNRNSLKNNDKMLSTINKDIDSDDGDSLFGKLSQDDDDPMKNRTLDELFDAVKKSDVPKDADLTSNTDNTTKNNEKIAGVDEPSSSSLDFNNDVLSTNVDDFFDDADEFMKAASTLTGTSRDINDDEQLQLCGSAGAGNIDDSNNLPNNDVDTETETNTSKSTSAIGKFFNKMLNLT